VKGQIPRDCGRVSKEQSNTGPEDKSLANVLYICVFPLQSAKDSLKEMAD
jgi:hypothetical protein